MICTYHIQVRASIEELGKHTCFGSGSYISRPFLTTIITTNSQGDRSLGYHTAFTVMYKFEINFSQVRRSFL